MTQQYLIGQFSVLLEDLRRSLDDFAAVAVLSLRREVERAPVQRLPVLASEAVSLMDSMCWAALDRGDTASFVRAAKVAMALDEFTAAAGLSGR
jgi:hypothetical protein